MPVHFFAVPLPLGMNSTFIAERKYTSKHRCYVEIREAGEPPPWSHLSAVALPLPSISARATTWLHTTLERRSAQVITRACLPLFQQEPRRFNKTMVIRRSSALAPTILPFPYYGLVTLPGGESAADGSLPFRTIIDHDVFGEVREPQRARSRSACARRRSRLILTIIIKWVFKRNYFFMGRRKNMGWVRMS